MRVVLDWLTGTTLAAAQLTAEGVMRELAALIFADPGQLFDPDTGSLKPPSDWPDGVAKFITPVDVADLLEGSGAD